MKEPNIRLRALELEDLDFLYQIENDDRLWELGVSNVPYSRRVLLDYITSASADIYVDNQVRLIVENEQNDQVGILDLTDFDPRHHHGDPTKFYRAVIAFFVLFDPLALIFRQDIHDRFSGSAPGIDT